MYQGHVHVHIDRTYQVKYLIHPDDTGIDKTTVEDLQTRAESQAVRSAVVAGQASYATSAQTSNANVNKISTDASYSDVELAKKKQKEVEAQNAVLIIVVAVLGGVFGCCCIGLGGFFGMKFMRGSRPSAQAASGENISPLQKMEVHTSYVTKASSFCPSCGTRNEDAKFCGKCGHPIETISNSDAI